MVCYGIFWSGQLTIQHALWLILYPDLPRPRERELSLFSIRQNEIWVRDYIAAMDPGGASKAKQGNVEVYDWIS